MRRIKVLAAEEAMTAADQADALVTMNGAMHRFNTDGIYYAHTDLAASDTVNMPDELIDSLIWLVAESLAPDYAYAFSPQEDRTLMSARNHLQAYYWVQPPADTEPALRPWPARYNINTDQ